MDIWTEKVRIGKGIGFSASTIFNVFVEHSEKGTKKPGRANGCVDSGPACNTPSQTQQIFELLVLQVSIGVEMI